jgi:hypothetical protein
MYFEISKKFIEILVTNTINRPLFGISFVKYALRGSIIIDESSQIAPRLFSVPLCAYCFIHGLLSRDILIS